MSAMDGLTENDLRLLADSMEGEAKRLRLLVSEWRGRRSRTTNATTLQLADMGASWAEARASELSSLAAKIKSPVKALPRVSGAQS